MVIYILKRVFVLTIWSLPHITRFVTQRAPPVEQELLTLPKHPRLFVQSALFDLQFSVSCFVHYCLSCCLFLPFTVSDFNLVSSNSSFLKKCIKCLVISVYRFFNNVYQLYCDYQTKYRTDWSNAGYMFPNINT